MPVVRVRPFKFRHYKELRLEGQDVGVPLDPALAALLAKGGIMRTFAVDGHPVVVVGVAPRHGFGHAWCYAGTDAKHHVLALVRLGRKLLDEAHGQWPALEAGVLVGNAVGYRLLKILGFNARAGEGGRVPALSDSSRVYQLFERHRREMQH